MATSKPISSISFNSKEFLIHQLQILIDNSSISFYCFIKHDGEFNETDEVCGKEHFHLLLIPNKSLDLAKLQLHFVEPTPTNSIPLKCLPFRKSSVDDAILYFIHDQEYLLFKGMIRQFSYTLDEVVSSDPDYLYMLYIEARRNFVSLPVNRLANYAKKGIPFNVLVASGVIPIQQVHQAMTAYQILMQTNFTEHFDSK